ncbi:hypothetical protein ACQKIE_17795 [Luteibacter sp. NPDC031894]|uniref:hypothetical protein n=1 Tax=Luteibacter sp. NPDC031894 TaxID=3390572 RepID=UPI003D035EEF
MQCPDGAAFARQWHGAAAGGQDEKPGLVYQGRVALAKNPLLVDGTKVKVTPGMSLSVEIKTDQRRVIDYLLSPLQQETQEAMRER